MRLVTLIGGSGFVGRYAAQAFARAGWRVRVAVRRPNEALALRIYGDVGQVEPAQANIRDDASIAAAVRGADVVVNLVGILAPLGAQTFEAVQAEGPRRVAAVAKAAGVKRMIQISAIGADPDSKSQYAKTKAIGEAAVREIMPNAVILRPSIVFGPEDQFFNRFAAMARLTPVLPMVGASTRFQPVYVNDVAKAIVAAAEAGGEVDGATLELGGPSIYTFADLMRMMLKTIQRQRGLLPIPFFAAKLKAWFLDLIPFLTFGALPNSILTVDQVRMLQKDNVVDPARDGMKALGVQPTGPEAIIPTYLYRFRPYGQYEQPTIGEPEQG